MSDNGVSCSDDEMQIVTSEAHGALAQGITRIDIGDYALLGEHNRHNLMAAAAACLGVGVELEALAPHISDLLPLPHRLEPVPSNDGLRWINDSKSTNVAAALISLSAVPRPVVLLLGGRGKGEDYAPMAEKLRDLEGIVSFGDEGTSIAESLEQNGCEVHHCGDLVDAVKTARGIASPGSAVLLSPACASWDAYGNFMERGIHFRRLAGEVA